MCLQNKKLNIYIQEQNNKVNNLKKKLILNKIIEYFY